MLVYDMKYCHSRDRERILHLGSFANELAVASRPIEKTC